MRVLTQGLDMGAVRSVPMGSPSHVGETELSSHPVPRRRGSWQAKPGGPAGGGGPGGRKGSPFSIDSGPNCRVLLCCFWCTGLIGAPQFDGGSVYPTDRPVLKQDYSRVVAPWISWARSFFVVGGCPWHHRMFRCIPGLSQLGAGSNPPPQVVRTRNVYRNCHKHCSKPTMWILKTIPCKLPLPWWGGC